MKKILLAGLLAVSAIAMTQQEASAWVNSRFGIGLNWDWQSGGNSILWGLWRNGQPPGPEAYGMPGHAPNCPRPAMGHPYQPSGLVPAPQGFTPVPNGFGTAPGGAALPQMYHPNPYATAAYPRPNYYYPTPYQYGR